MKKLISFVLALCVCVGLLSFPTAGAVSWSLEGTVLTVSGNGAMEDLSYDGTAPWGTDITKIVVAEGVTHIGNYAFKDCVSVAEISLPQSLKSIGAYAFYGCEGISTLSVPATVEKIGNRAFYGCSALDTISLPDSVRYIDGTAFYNTAYYNDTDNWENGMFMIGNHLIKMVTDALREGVSLPENTVTVADGALSYCQIASLVIGGNVQRIGDNAFLGCTDLATVTIEEGVEEIGNTAFYGCTALTSVSLPKSLKSVGAYSFNDCTAVVEVTYGGTREDWDSISIDEGNAPLVNAYLAQFAPPEDSSEDSEEAPSESDDTPIPDDVLFGDVNGDSFINSLDAAQVLKHDAMLAQLSADSLARADVNGDGAVDSLDAAQILKFDAMLIDRFPVEN